MELIHGGQDNNLLISLQEDFSVTTNLLGPNKNGLQSIINNISEINHYPDQNYFPFINEFIHFLYKDLKNNNNVILGNGASELIDLVIRNSKAETWCPGSDTQYLEYERSARNYGKKRSQVTEADLIFIINPVNPTGHYKNINELKTYIETNAKNGTSIIVDESMQPWVGGEWRNDSLLSQTDWINKLAKNNNIYIFIIHSWTKIFSCTGLRFGSLICPTTSNFNMLKKLMIPWNVNILAIKYIETCIKDDKYLEKTWKKTKKLRKYQIKQLKELFDQWSFEGEAFLSWIWINTKNENLAKLVYEKCKLNGTPIRLGKNGYEQNTYIRIAVRKKKYFKKMISCLIPLSNLNKSISYQNKINWINFEEIKLHEQVIVSSANKLKKYLINSMTKDGFTIPSIIICSKTKTLIDGHHRLYCLKKLGFKLIPCTMIDYEDNNILVNPNNLLMTKDIVVNTARKDKLLEPKSTEHKIIINKQIFPINILSKMVFLSEYNKK